MWLLAVLLAAAPAPLVAQPRTSYREVVERYAAGEAFLDALRPQDEIALLSFNEELTWLAATRERQAVSRALHRLRAAGTERASHRPHAARDPSRTLVVLFTDGEDNVSWLDERQLRVAVERSNALVHVAAHAATPPHTARPRRRTPTSSPAQRGTASPS